MKAVKYMDEESVLKKGVELLIKGLGPLEAMRFMNISRERTQNRRSGKTERSRTTKRTLIPASQWTKLQSTPQLSAARRGAPVLAYHGRRRPRGRDGERQHEGDMARYRRMDVLNAMYATGIVPVFYHPDLEVVTNVARACARGGARLLEFTNRGDFAWEVFRELERFCAKEVPEMITGVGSVVDPGTATLYINNGASFVVGPVLNAEVARACNRRKVPYSPGCGTASEISAAEELGCEIVKIFPGAEVGGPPFVKAVKGPCPWTSIMPTGGVEPTEASLSAWFKAGVACVGIGSNLITKEILAAKDWDGLAKKVAETLAIVQKVRGK